MVIKDDDILGYVLGNECVCRGCIERDELLGLSMSEVIVYGNIDGNRYFCDRCGEAITTN